MLRQPDGHPMKHILYLCHRIPFPPNKGDKIRSFNILRHLSQKYTVSLGFLVDSEKDIQYVSSLKDFANIVICESICNKYRKLISLINAFVKSKPISIPFFYSTGMQDKLDKLIESDSIDIVICSSSPSAEYMFQSKYFDNKLKRSKLVMDLIDMDSQKWKEYAKKQRFPFSYIYNRESNYLLEYEKLIEKQFDKLLVVSDAEKYLFNKYIPTKKMCSVSNGVDLEFFNPRHDSAVNLNHPALVFTGAMDYWPNIHGAMWFVQKVLPLIRTTIPEVNLYLVGSNPSRQLKQLEKQQGVTVTGFVDDVRDYIAGADICVIPLHIARGIQNKVLEAMAMGKAVVSTPEATEGLNIDYENDLCVRKDERSFARSVIALLQDKQTSSNLARNARSAMERNYSWEHNLSLLDELLAQGEQSR